MKKRHILGFCTAVLIGLSSVAQPAALTVNAQELVPPTANETRVDHEHSGTFAVYSEVYRVNAAGQPDAAQNVTLRFIQTDALKVGFVGAYTGEFQVAKDRTLAEQGISFPRVGNELTAGFGYKPVFKYKGAVIMDLNFRIDADAEIRVEAVREGATDPDEVYYAFYEFESMTMGKGLPQEVVDALPEDATEYQNGNVVHAILPNPAEVEVADGTWVFKGYDFTSQTVNVNDVRFRGKWVFTKKAATINQAPVIKAGNRVLIEGDAFDPLEGVTAEDAEDGTIPMTEKNIKEQNVDRTTAGEYFVIFVVSDKQGAMTEKRIEVTVKEKENAGQENPKPNDPPAENPKPNDPPAENPKPNDPPAENPKPNKPSEERPMPGTPQAEKPNNSQMNQTSQNGTSKQESQADKTEKNEVRKQEQVKQDSASSAVKTPKTGDRTPIGLLAGAAIISIISLTVILVRKIVKNKSK